MQGEDGKKLKTRCGDTVKLRDLLDEAVNHAEENLRQRLSKEGREENEQFMQTISGIDEN